MNVQRARTGVKISLNQRDACIYYRQNPIQCIKSSAATDEFGTLRTFSASSLGLSVNGYRYNAKHTVSYEEPSAPESKGVNRPGV